MKQINLIYKYRVFSLIAMMALSLLGTSCKDEDNFEALGSEKIISAIELKVTERLPLLVNTDSLIAYTVLPDDAGNAMASVAAAAYSIGFRQGYEPDFDYRKALRAFYEQPEIIVTKKTKRSEATFDMKPYIYECTTGEDGRIHLTVDASSSGNIKPSLVINAFYEQNGATLDEIALLITREETYMNIGNEEQRELVPLDFIGKEF